MKKLLIAIILFTLSIAGFGQVTKGFFQPVKTNPYFDQTRELTVDRTTGLWLLRMSAGATANLFTINKETKKIELSTFSKIGMGLSYAHYKDVDGLPYNDFSINGFLFVPTAGEYTTSIAVTVSAFQYLQAGINYDAGLKQFGLLTGVKYSF